MDAYAEANPQVKQYDIDMSDEPFDNIYRNANDYVFGLQHGDRWDRPALNFMGARTSFRQLDKEIDIAARALFAYGIRRGDYVTFVMPNMKETVVYVYACWRIGAVTNMVDPRTNPEGILQRTNRTNSKLLITMFNLCADCIDEILDRLCVRNIILTSPSDSLRGSLKLKPVLGTLIYDAKMNKFARERNLAADGRFIRHRDFIRGDKFMDDFRAGYQRGMLAAVVYTSGTASDGVIKGAAMTHEALNAAPAALHFATGKRTPSLLFCAPDRKDRSYRMTFGGFVPFFAAYGMQNGMHTSLAGGGELILVPIFDHNKFADMLLKIKCNSFLGIPRFHEQLADHPKLQKKNKRLAFLRIPISGGDKISPASIERVNATYARSGSKVGLRVGYGSTELGGSIAVMPAYEPTAPSDGDSGFNWRAEGNVGYLLPQCKAVVIDPDTRELLPHGEEGELCVCSLAQMEGYWGHPEQTDEITYIHPDGTKYYRMGDRCRLDENGRIYFTGRYKRSLMRPDGFTVHPGPMENAISEHEAVSQCAVAGLSRKKGMAGTISTAFVVLREGFSGDPEKRNDILRDIDRLCLKRLPTYYRPLAYRAVSELPYTPMGKVDFRALEKEIFDPANFLVVDYEFFPELRQKELLHLGAAHTPPAA